MPELPEVETTRRGIESLVLGRLVEQVAVREARLRWPVPREIGTLLPGCRIEAVQRRGKYLLFRTDGGSLILHLGMSGSLRVVPSKTPPGKHDHVDIRLSGGSLLRFNDPRRFGCLLWTHDDPLQHHLLSGLGPEPLQDGFGGEYLYRRSRRRSVPVKNFLMDSRVVVGIGNIYANEALYVAGIRPDRSAGRISALRYGRLAAALRQVLGDALAEGGTTLRDFVGGDGRPGYFRQRLQVYARGGQPCYGCGRELREARLGQRSTVYCATCQT